MNQAKLLIRYSFILLLAIWARPCFAQNSLMVLPTHNNTYSTTTRGFWFTAPTNFIITGLRVPASAGSGQQFIQVMRLNGTFPISSSSPSVSFTNLTYIANATSGLTQTVNIQVNAGDVIGIFGTAGTSCSEGNGSYTTSIGGQSVTLNRLEYSGAINSSSATSYFGVANGGSGSIGRVEMFYNATQPCFGVGNLAVTNINSVGASVSWAAPASTLGYEYAVTLTSAPPTNGITPTSSTNATVNNLTASSSYYFQVRRKCQQGNWSSWDTLKLNTLDSCTNPGAFYALYVDSNKAYITWGTINNAIGYQYLVDRTRLTPVGNHPDIKTITNNQDSVKGLTEGTWYYVHIRALCGGNDSSAWSLDSFYTPIHCRAPIIKITDISTSQGVASWNNVQSALKYEYAITKGTAIPPLYGVPWNNTSYYLPYLNDGEVYYFHARTICLDINTQYRSQWTTIPFITFPLGIKAIEQGARLNIYPNPVTDKLTVDVSLLSKAEGRIVIVDVSGRQVYSAMVQGKKEISLKHLNAGVYFLKYNDGISAEVVKLIKQ
ncbi:MAG: T9SS type A sorting domain-containing protein [Flavipsychrobacter sp.]